MLLTNTARALLIAHMFISDFRSTTYRYRGSILLATALDINFGFVELEAVLFRIWHWMVDACALFE